MNLKPIIEQSFTQYAGAVLQSRALVDVRDCLKPSARQIFYCLYTDKFIHSKPFKKTLKAIGSAMRMYIHGDSSCEGVIMRAGQPFAMRYPLVEVEGSYGNLIESGNWAAPRYTAARLSALAEYLFKDIDKDTILEWRDNYDDTEQYPSVLSTKGYFNLVNGTSGIGIGAASSVPQYNIKDLNNALITLLLNPECDFEDIYCAPDFATGATLLNEAQVKESMKNGTGFACKLRATVNYDSGEKCLIATEIPYGVYTNTICGELDKILESEDNPGIDRFNDLTGEKPLIKIYLTKKANVDKIIKYLYKNTSLQHYYGINFTMLEDGRFPKVFTWKEILQSHIDHEKNVYNRAFNYDIAKMKSRIHILEGLLICLASIDEVVKTIKNSPSAPAARDALCEFFLLDEAQAKAVLDMKLSRLAHLEVKKIENEKKELEDKVSQIEAILNSEELFNNELIKGWKETAEKFGDARRTKILNVEAEEDEPVEIESLVFNLSNKNNLYVSKTSSLYTQKRGGVGSKFKLDKDEHIVASSQGETTDTLLFFTNNGYFFHYTAAALPIEEKIPLESLFALSSANSITTFIALNKNNKASNVIFFTKNGLMKKSKLDEYNIKRKGSLKAMELAPNDEICSIVFVEDEKVAILSEFGQLLICETKDIRPIGRVAKGVKSIKLNELDAVCTAKVVPSDTKEIVSISNTGLIKRTDIKEFGVNGRYTKGSKVQKLKSEDEYVADILPISIEPTIVITSTKAQIKVDVNEIPISSKGTLGARAQKIIEGSYIISLSKF